MNDTLTENDQMRLAKIRADNMRWLAQGMGEDWDTTLLLKVIDRLNARGD